MNASPSSVLTLGFGTWGSAPLVVTLGFGGGGVVGRWTEVLTLSCDPQGTLAMSVDSHGTISLSAEKISP